LTWAAKSISRLLAVGRFLSSFVRIDLSVAGLYMSVPSSTVAA